MLLLLLFIMDNITLMYNVTLYIQILILNKNNIYK